MKTSAVWILHMTFVGVLLLLSLPFRSSAQVRLLDDFETLAGWKAIPSEGASLRIASVPGRTGNAMEMDFDLSKASGYVLARKEMPIDLSEDYQFVFDIRGETPVNNFELIDDKENVFWIKKLNTTYPTSWTRQHIWKHQLTFAWVVDTSGLRATELHTYDSSSPTHSRNPGTW
jgi:hypothetical protein